MTLNAVPTYDADIDATVTSIWSAMIDLPLEAVDPAADQPTAAITAVVVLDGDFEGAVKVSCGVQLADRIASMMFAADAPTPDDVRDALGEMANMIAGNLKTVLSGPSHMGLPIVTMGSDYVVSIPRARLVGLAAYVSEGDYLHVSLAQQEASA